jgi:lysophospholipid acyltransferase (LPLAT)-like uncharacterized protein
MKLRKPWMINLAARVGVRVVRLWMSTVRCKTDSRGQQTDPWDPTLRERYIYAMWHEGLFLVPKMRSAAPVTVLSSHSADAEFVVQMLRGTGLEVVRGSSSRGGMDAVDGLMSVRERSHLLLTPDGPRGPRHEVKRGLVYLAAWTKMRIVPLGVGFSKAWRAKSWDRTAIPRPFSTLTCVAGPVIRVPSGAGKATMEQYRLLVERSLMAATAAAEAWAHGQPPAEWPALDAPAA